MSLFCWLLYVAFKTSNPRERSVAVGQVFIDFEENSSSRNYLVFDDANSGVRIKYPSNWDALERLGNILGNNKLVDFYHTDIDGSLGYSENAYFIVLDLLSMDPEPFDKFTKSTIQIVANNLNNFTLQESILTVVSGVPAHKITYTLAGNQSEIK